MSYIEDALEEVKRVTPISGVNVCIFDDFEEVGNKLETIANFDTVEEAQDFIDNYEDDEVELVMYEAEESTEYNTKYPSFSTQKNHNVDNYIDMAQNDYEKGVNRDNDEYENTNYRKTTEKLNKDGTGVKRATRGLDPKKTPAKVLEFVYVSKSECEICRQYDGQIFATDSPNRPIIPRLESQGKKGTRPYTHPNCKCKWVRPFSKTGLKNFGQTRGGEAEAHELKQKTIDMARQTIVGFDKLSKRDQYIVITHMLKKMLRSDESFDPTSLPIASIIKMTFDAIEPTLALQLNRMKHTHTNEVRSLIDDMVGESLTSERKHEIVLEHNLDFTLENLLGLTVTALEHDVWDEETNKLVDPSLLEDKEEDNEAWGNWNEEPEPMSQHDQIKMMRDLGIADKTLKDIGYDLSNEGLDDEEQYMPDVYNIDPYPHRHEFIDNVCVICDYVLKASEDHSKPYTDKFGKRHVSWTCPKCGEEFGIAGHSGEGERFEHMMSHESKATEGGRGSGRKGHQKWMLGAEADPEECPNCMIFTEKKNGNCQICGNSY